VFWGAALLVKKGVVYKAANSYGWPRIYKRLLEQTKIHVEIDTRPHVNHLIKTAIRAPTEAYAAVMDTEVHKALTKIVDVANTSAKTTLPPFLYTLVSTAVEGLLPVRAGKDIHSSAKTKTAQSRIKISPPLPPPSTPLPWSGKRSFSSSPKAMPTGAFLRREVKILLGVAVGTATCLYFYNKYNEDGIHDLPAARHRHDLAMRAVAAKHKGDWRTSIKLYEELLEKQRTLALTDSQEIKEEKQTKFDVECQILSELGGLYWKGKAFTRSIEYYHHAARIAKSRNLAKEFGSLCDRIAQVNTDAKQFDIAEQYFVEALHSFIPPHVSTPIFGSKGSQTALEMSMVDLKKWWRSPVKNSDIIVVHTERFAMASGVLYNFASMYAEMGRLQQAESVLKRCVVASKLSGGSTAEQEEKILLLLNGLILLKAEDE
jgi:tetratricopeptide (TPR) repeat protein